MIFAGTPAASAAPIEIDVSVTGPTAAAPAALDGRVSATLLASTTGRSAPPEPRETALRQGRARLSLAPGQWRLSATVAGHWVAPESVEIITAAPPASVTLRAFVLGRARGTLLPVAGAALPARLSLAFARPRASRDEPRPWPPDDEFEFPCRLEGRAFECPLPAARVDFNLRAAGHVPHYRWNALVPSEGAFELATVTLPRGASLAGRVQTTPPARPTAGRAVATPRVELREIVPERARPAGAPRPPAPRVWSAATDARGFFQLGPVPPGAYTLQPQQAGLTAVEAPLTLSPEAETRLPRALTLTPPRTLRVVFDPPLDPWEGFWSVQLLAGEGQVKRIVVRNSSAGADGHWRQTLAPGNYRVVISSSRGERWHQRDVSVEGDELLHLDLRGQRVTGSVRLGARPLPALVTFGGRSGASRVPLQADAEGAFAGFIPPREADDDRPWIVSVDCPDPPVRRTLGLRLDPERDGSMRADIVLAHTVLRGVVLDPQRRPVSTHALVNLWAQDDPREESVVQTIVAPEDEGRFQLEGLRPGEYLIHAGSGARFTSEEQLVTVEERRETPPVELLLQEDRHVSGRVLSPEGQPVPGASVFLLAAERPFSPLPTLRTDAEGRFIAKKVPGDTRELKVRVAARGFAYWIARLRLPEDGVLEIRLTRAGGLLRLDASTDAVLLFGEHYVVVGWLDMWAPGDGVARDEEGRRLVPLMPAGRYRLCQTRNPADLRAALGGAPLAGQCVAGDLTLGGELELRAPQAPAS